MTDTRQRNHPCPACQSLGAGIFCSLHIKQQERIFLADKRKRRKAKPYEIDIQRKCVKWFRDTYPDIVIYAIRNEAKYSVANKHYGALANMDGRHEGVADLCVLAMRDSYGALYVEMKRPKTGKKDETAQLEFAAYCVRSGYRYALCDNKEDFQSICNEYLS
jgi:hypothetical protein